MTDTPPDALSPFYFSEGLFGCLHEAPSGRRGAVICQPFGHEYITLHRAARLLAARLARSGISALRFDYRGTGDSAGDLADVGLADWREDVSSAVVELRRRTAVERVSLIGVRLGAALALEAGREIDGLETLALWDPVIWGRAYLRELRRDTRRMYRVAHVVRRRQSADRREVLGFRLGERLEEDLRALALDTGDDPGAERVLLLETQNAAAAPLGARLRSLGVNVETRLEAAPRMWRWSEDITRLQLPHAQVRALATWVAEAA